jgi:hypothetical protein
MKNNVGISSKQSTYMVSNFLSSIVSDIIRLHPSLVHGQKVDRDISIKHLAPSAMNNETIKIENLIYVYFGSQVVIFSSRFLCCSAV